MPICRAEGSIIMGAGKARHQRFAQQNISHSEGIYRTPQAYIASRQRYITSVFGADKYRFGEGRHMIKMRLKYQRPGRLNCQGVLICYHRSLTVICVFDVLAQEVLIEELLPH